MAGIDLNRTSAGVSDLLPREISQEIWANAVGESAIMQASRQINIPGSGVAIPIITGDAEADWVNETDEKPVSDPSISSKVLTPYKLAVIETFSDRVPSRPSRPVRRTGASSPVRAWSQVR